MAAHNLEVTVASGDALDVVEFDVHERMSGLFQVTLTVRSENPDIDFEAVIGQDASFTLHGGVVDRPHAWKGLCSEIHQIRVEPTGLSTYHLAIVPAMWLLSQRRNHRMFQLLSEPDIVTRILGEWGIEPVKRLTGTYKKRKYRVQYAETDHDFVCRMLEDAGISFYFEQSGGETRLVLHDAPQKSDLRAPRITFVDTPTTAQAREHVTRVRIGRRVRPGKYTLRDHDYRRPPAYKLVGTAAKGEDVEEKLERFHYTPGAFLFEADRGEATPHADDKGKYRTDEGEATQIAERRLHAKRSEATTGTFETNVVDLSPGMVMGMLDHPRSDLGDGKRLLVVEATHHGSATGSFAHRCEIRSADVPYHPPLVTGKPKVNGVESATVVGPAGEEIHTDEFGRVRVHFHWDRESQMNEKSSCWIHVSQPWGGAGYGGVNLPRIGQEVLVDFLGGDPDRPIMVGRVYTNLQKVPYGLPANKTQSGWKSSSSPQTGGYNEIMFEDAAGKELVRMQAEKDLNKLVKHDEEHVVGNDRARLVGHDESVTVGNSRSKAIGNNETLFVGSNQSEQIGANHSLSIGLASAEVVGAAKTLTVGAFYAVTVGEKVTITCGASTITMDKDGKIVASGKDIFVEASGVVNVKAQGDVNVESAADVNVKGANVNMN